MTYLRSDAHLIVERDELFVESAVRLLGGGRGGGRALDKWPIIWQYSSTLTNHMTVSWSEEHWPIRLQYPHHFVFWPIRLQYSSTFTQLCVCHISQHWPIRWLYSSNGNVSHNRPMTWQYICIPVWAPPAPWTCGSACWCASSGWTWWWSSCHSWGHKNI